VNVVIKHLLLILTVSSLFSCRTNYKAAHFDNDEGFIDKRLSFNMFEIKFNGNAFSSIQQSIDYCMLRCAEVTKERGFNFFEVAFSETGMYSYLVKNPDMYGYVGGNAVILQGAYEHDIPIPVAKNIIVCFRQLPSNNFDSNGRKRLFYTADNVIQSVKYKYKPQP
jgi:hypothetical protein